MMKSAEIFYNYETICDLVDLIMEIEKTLERDGDLTNFDYDGDELLFCLRSASNLLMNYFFKERR